ncbi:MAG: 4Fe-4S binding protein [Desulfobacter sp.]|nr:MAG: 4Fe-4S binding protein [Desulfobacter sp.]
MADLFEQLANHLDTLPAGYPATESGVEIRILKRLFTPEEARITLGLTMMPEPVEPIAQRLDMDVQALAPVLESMSKKGLLYRSSKGGTHTYMASQFVVGIWEYQLKSLDLDLIQEVNEYLPQFMHKSWIKHETKQLRVIPISKEITAQMSIMDYESAEEIIRAQSKIVVSDCICRKEHEMVGKRCEYPMEVCLSFGSGAYYYEENGLGRSIDQKEALANLKTLDQPAKAVHTNYYARVDEEACIGCGICVDRCHMDAIVISDETQTARGEPDRCIGCGLCVPQCPEEAMKFEQKKSSDLYDPPANVFETYFTMAKERGNI